MRCKCKMQAAFAANNILEVRMLSRLHLTGAYAGSYLHLNYYFKSVSHPEHASGFPSKS